MKKISVFVLLTSLIFSISSCNQNETSSSKSISTSSTASTSLTVEESSSYQLIDEQGNVNVSKVVAGENKNYLEVEGKPYTYNGIQIRVDWLKDVQKESEDEIEKYFEIASELGVTTVEIPIQWKDLEEKEGIYDFRIVSTYMNMAKKYNLKMEILFFGINITGMSGCIPKYIKNDKERFPQYLNTLNHPDALYFDLDNENLLLAERNVISAMMDSVYQWSINNKSNTVIAIQVKNEPDLLDMRLDQHDIRHLDGTKLTSEEARKENLISIDNAGKAVKESKYKVITRVNLACYNEHPEENMINWEDITALDSIDFVGEDTYSKDISMHKKIILDMQRSICKKYNALAQISENDGQYVDAAQLVLLANALGAGYNIYDMITPSVITDSWGYWDWGLLNNKTKEPKPTYYEIQKVLKGVNKIGEILNKTSSDNIAVFNLTTTERKKNKTQTIHTNYTTFFFETNSGAIGYALNYQDYIYMLTDNDSYIKICDSIIDGNVEEGYVDEKGKFVVNSSFVTTSNEINLVGGNLYRVKMTKSFNPTSNTIEQIL